MAITLGCCLPERTHGIALALSRRKSVVCVRNINADNIEAITPSECALMHWLFALPRRRQERFRFRAGGTSRTFLPLGPSTSPVDRFCSRATRAPRGKAKGDQLQTVYACSVRTRGDLYPNTQTKRPCTTEKRHRATRSSSRRKIPTNMLPHRKGIGIEKCLQDTFSLDRRRSANFRNKPSRGSAVKLLLIREVNILTL